MIVTIIFSFTYYLLKGYLYVLFWYSLIPLIAGIFYDVRKTIYASLIPLVVNTLIFPLVEFNKFGFKGSEAEGILLISVESLLSYFAFTIAVVIYRSFLDNYQKVVESLVERDSLTGAFSRRKLFKILEERFRVSLEKAEPLSLLMLDIDRFKKVNDTYGHQVGDLVLKKLVEVVKKSVRSSDVVGRYGGEEFLIVLPNTQLGDALKVAEKIRKNVENTNFPVVGEVTISIGVTAGDRNTLRNKNLDSLIQEADDALYLAKKRGRNRVETVLELVRV
ncbi:GGDEF domain-containing protein [Phorcysia thermohydrogeniphila]|nr:GGDEF domain-containing protein [Phorcysia thermohydrogeniphila]